MSTRARYALRMMVDVARNGTDNRPVSLTSVSERTNLSRGYLEQLALALRNARLLRSVSGRYGGYMLARPPSQITLGEIIETAIGAVCIVGCLEEPDRCELSPSCECRVVYSLINRRIGEVLHSFTLGNLLDPEWATVISQQVEGQGEIATVQTSDPRVEVKDGADAQVSD